MTKRIVLADPRGFCAGVDRAILTVQTILKAANTSRNDGVCTPSDCAQQACR